MRASLPQLESPVERSLALLGAKFCHDIASPINALGLILETAQSDPSSLALANQSQQDLAMILALYRMLFSYRNTGALAGSAWHWMQKEAREHKRRLRLPVLDEPAIADWLSKIILSVYAFCVRSTKDGGGFSLEFAPSTCTIQWNGPTRLPGVEHLLTPPDPATVDSTAAFPSFIHALASSNSATASANNEQDLIVTVRWQI